MKKEKDILEMTDQELYESGLWKPVKDDFDTMFAKSLVRKNEVKAYKKLIIKEFNKTQDLDEYLDRLSILEKAETIERKINAKKMETPLSNAETHSRTSKNDLLLKAIKKSDKLGMTIKDFKIAVA